MSAKSAADFRRGTQMGELQTNTTGPQPPGSPASGGFSLAGVEAPTAASFLNPFQNRHKSIPGIVVQIAKQRLGSFLQILFATLREIFDENAYQRFLERTGQAASVQSYRQFQREREIGIAKRPRCC
jgi:hypothetical protein